MIKNVFISSTFNDMHNERDAIQRFVIPRVNALAGRFGDSVSACDLRWGVDTTSLPESENTKKVLNVCLDEIDRCHPYMIVLLGERYGWMPGKDAIGQAAGMRDGFRPEDLNISVTQLEIEYGLHKSPDWIGRTLFYFRESGLKLKKTEDAAHRAKLQKLKDKLSSVPGARVRRYRGSSERWSEAEAKQFSNMVSSDLVSLMQEEWQKNAALDRYEADQLVQWNYQAGKAAQFSAGGDLLAECLQVLRDRKQDLILFGESGSGKSTLAAKLAGVLRDGGTKVIPLFCGNTRNSDTESDLLQYIVWMLEKELDEKEHFGVPQDDRDHSQEWYQRLEQLYARWDARDSEDLCFVIDAVDQLVGAENRVQLVFLPRRERTRVRFLLTSTDPELSTVIRVRKHMPAMTERTVEEVVNGILVSKHRELPRSVKDEIIRAGVGRLPIHVSLTVQRLLMMDREDFEEVRAYGDGAAGIAAYQCELVRSLPASTEDLSNLVLQEAAKKLGGGAVRRFLLLIAHSRRGLRLSDVQGILWGMQMEWNQLECSEFMHYVGDTFLHRSDGRIDIAHRIVRDGLLKLTDEHSGWNSVIAMYLDHLPDTDPLKQSELIWHTLRSGQDGVLAELIAEYMSGSSEELRRILTKDTMEYVLDRKDWMVGFLGSVWKHPAYGFISGFFLNDVYYELPVSEKGRELRYAICQTILRTAERRAGSEPNERKKWDLSVACERMSAACREDGTAEAKQAALQYAVRSLKIREEVLQSTLLLKTVAEKRALTKASLKEMGVRVNQKISDEQHESLYRMTVDEFRRGVCVAHKDIAECLACFADEGHWRKEIWHREASLRIREMIRKNSGSRATSASIDNELIQDHIDIGKACEKLEGPEMAQKAEQHLSQAVTDARALVREEENPENQVSLIRSLLALGHKRIRDGSFEEGIAITRETISLASEYDRRARNSNSCFLLSAAYELLGDLWAQRNAEGDVERANEAYRTARNILNGSEADKKSAFLDGAAIVDLKLANTAGESGTEPGESRLELILRACDSAERLLQNDAVRKNHEALKEALQQLREVANGLEADEGLKLRICSEIDYMELRELLRCRDVTVRDRYQSVMRCTGIADGLVEKSAPIPPDARTARQILEHVGVREAEMEQDGLQRAYEICGLGFQTALELDQADHSLANRDLLAVCGMKYLMISAMHQSDRLPQLKALVQNLAMGLYRETNKEKYLTILATVNLLDRL